MPRPLHPICRRRPSGLPAAHGDTTLPWKSLFWASPDVAAVVDPAGTVVVINQAWAAAQVRGGDLAGSGVGSNYLAVCERSALGGDEVAEAVRQGLLGVLHGESDRFRLDYPCETPSEMKWFRMEATPLPWVPGHARLVAIRHLDVTEWVHARQDLQAQAMTDPLTALPNRRALTDRIRVGLGITDPRPPTLLMIVDIDHFKSINDCHGHLFGDACLVRVAQLLRENSREQDMVSRWGGDEFILLVEAGTDAGLASAEARIRRLVTVRYAGVDIGLSWGSALAAPGDTYDSLVARADQQLRTAKAARPHPAPVPAPDPNGPHLPTAGSTLG